MGFLSHYRFPSGILDALDDRGLLELSCVSRRLAAEARAARAARRAERAASCLSFFYFAHFDLFSLDRTLYGDWERRVRQLFCFLPEFFLFLEEQKVRALDLAALPPYITVPAQLWGERNVRCLLRVLLQYLRGNRTLHYCHLGLFERFITVTDVYELIHGHPTLGILYVDKGVPVSFYRRAE